MDGWIDRGRQSPILMDGGSQCESGCVSVFEDAVWYQLWRRFRRENVDINAHVPGPTSVSLQSLLACEQSFDQTVNVDTYIRKNDLEWS